MPKPSREQLALFFIDSDTFEGIDVNAALNEFFEKIYPEGEDNIIWVVVDGSPESAQVVTATYDEDYVYKIEEILPKCSSFGVEIDQFKAEVNAGMSLFKIEVKSDGTVDYAEKAQTYEDPFFGFGPGWHSITGTFWGFSLNMATRIALKALKDNLASMPEGWDEEI